MSKDFRFFDNRQKYLLFVTTTNEKNKIAEKISTQIKNIKPKKPALKFDYSSCLTIIVQLCLISKQNHYLDNQNN